VQLEVRSFLERFSKIISRETFLSGRGRKPYKAPYVGGLETSGMARKDGTLDNGGGGSVCMTIRDIHRLFWSVAGANLHYRFTKIYADNALAYAVVASLSYVESRIQLLLCFFRNHPKATRDVSPRRIPIFPCSDRFHILWQALQFSERSALPVHTTAI
jgi:hypothetical protein